MHKDWVDTKSVYVNNEIVPSNLFSSKGKIENEQRLRAQEAFEKYGGQGEPRERKSDYQTDLNQICQI